MLEVGKAASIRPKAVRLTRYRAGVLRPLAAAGLALPLPEKQFDSLADLLYNIRQRVIVCRFFSRGWFYAKRSVEERVSNMPLPIPC